jgi:hypothetical protein
MGEPRSISGHSLEWQQAYLMATPEDSAQRDLVAQLALPVGENQTREQAQRVEVIQTQIALMDPRTAYRLYQRLTSPGDALGQLFHLTLHHTTRKSLLGYLDAKRHDYDRGTAPVSRSTDNRNVPQPRPVPSPPPKPVQDTDIPWPPWWKPVKPGPPTPPHITTPPGNLWPWQPPWTMDDELQTDQSDSKPKNWIKTSLMAAASGLGMVLNVGLRAVTTPAMEKALEAAWIVFQTTEAEPAVLIGMAGEAAAEALLAEILGIDPALVRNLNDIESNFPVVDLISPRWLGSVKTRGILSTLPASALTDQLRSQYTSDLLNIIAGDKQAQGKLDKAADALFRNRRKLGRAWPADLKDTSRAVIRKYLQEKTILLVPDDHVQPLRRTLGADLYRRLKDNKKALEQLGIKDNQLATWVRSQIVRIQSMGPRSADFRVMAETAANHLPSDVTEKWRKKYLKILKQQRKRSRE